MILRRFSVLINLALISLIVWLLSDIFLTVISSRLDVPPRTKVVNSLKKPVKIKNHPLEYYSIIAGKDIFNPSANGKTKGTKKNTSEIEKELPPTDLNLELKGTIMGDSKDSYAIIEDKDRRKQDLYRLNDMIKEAQLVKILEDKVVLMRNGQEEILTMIYEKRSLNLTSPKRKKSKSVERISNTKYRLDRATITDTLGNLTQFMSGLNVKPYFVSGEPAGFHISRIKPGSLISKMGLRNGDIIKTINNMTISDPQQAIEVYQQLQNESSLTIEIQRRGRKKVYNYEIK